jgi:hypothetical protein
MAKRIREDLTGLFRLWLNPQGARDAAKDVEVVDRMIEAHPAPLPAPALLDRIKKQVQVRSIHRRRTHFMEGATAVAAAIMIVVGLSQFGPSRTRGFASLPTALWESDDIASDDLKLTYLNSEVARLEAQVQAIDNSESESTGVNTLDDLELELFQIDSDFWKG